jgi:hypothetical protein
VAGTKISALTDGGASISGDDYLVLVDAPAGVATTKRSTVTDFLAASVLDTALTARGVVLAGRTSAAGLGWVDTDTTLAADSATKVATQHAVKTYVDAHSGGGTGDVHQADTSVAGWAWTLDEDTMVSNSATKLPTQQSVKAYVDALPSLTTSDTVKVPIATVGGITTLDVSGLLSSAVANFADSALRVENFSDSTKKLAFNCTSIPTATTRTLGLPATTADDTLVLAAAIQTLTNKTHTSPIVQNNPLGNYITIRGGANTAVNDGTRSNLIEQFGSPSSGSLPTYAFLHASGSDAAPTQTIAASSIGRITARGYTGSAYSTAAAADIRFVSDEAHSTIARGTHFSTFVTPITTTTLTEGLRVTSDAVPGAVVRGALAVGANNSTMPPATTGTSLDVQAGTFAMNRQALTYASPTSVDVTLGNVFTVTTVNATGSVTFNATAGGKAGTVITFIITNDATSAKTITFGTNFKTTATLVGTASKSAVLTFTSDGTSWYESSRVTVIN